MSSNIDAACSLDDQTRGVTILSFLSMINYDGATRAILPAIGLRGVVHAHLLLRTSVRM